MELCFDCPSNGKEYSSENWRIMGELHVRKTLQGNRMLVGRVAVECPDCRGTHVYSVEDLASPWSRAGR